MSEDLFLSLLQNVGFPIAVTFFFMFKVDKTIERNTQIFEKVLEKLK